MRNHLVFCSFVFLAALTGCTATVESKCPYENRLASWEKADEVEGIASEKLMRPGVAWEVEHITVCRNGSAVFLRGEAGSDGFAVRFIRANQDSFQAVVGSRFVIEKRVSFRRDSEKPSLTLDFEGRVTLQWKDQSTEIDGERFLYVSPGSSQ